MKIKVMNKFNDHSDLPFKWVDSTTDIKLSRHDSENHTPEDDCIVDKNNVEVLGSSEWLRISEEDREFIVEACNSYYEMKQEIEDLKKLIELTELEGKK
jgi:hypothetical protein